jgi:ABC-type multidrug transport system fused ATPase/permease subunit
MCWQDFMMLSSGSIEIDGIDIRKIQLVDLAKVDRHRNSRSYIFNDTITKIMYCAECLIEGDEKIWEALDWHMLQILSESLMGN